MSINFPPNEIFININIRKRCFILRLFNLKFLNKSIYIIYLFFYKTNKIIIKFYILLDLYIK